MKAINIIFAMSTLFLCILFYTLQAYAGAMPTAIAAHVDAVNTPVDPAMLEHAGIEFLSE